MKSLCLSVSLFHSLPSFSPLLICLPANGWGKTEDGQSSWSSDENSEDTIVLKLLASSGLTPTAVAI